MLTNVLSIAVNENLYDEIFKDKKSGLLKGLIDEIKNNQSKSNLDILNEKIFQTTGKSYLISLCFDLLKDYYRKEGKELDSSIGDPYIYFLLYKKFEKIEKLIDEKDYIKDKQFIKDLIYFIGKSIEIINQDQIDIINAKINQYEKDLKPIQKKDKTTYKKDGLKPVLFMISLFVFIAVVLLFVVFFGLLTKQDGYS